MLMLPYVAIRFLFFHVAITITALFSPRRFTLRHAHADDDTPLSYACRRFDVVCRWFRLLLLLMILLFTLRCRAFAAKATLRRALRYAADIFAVFGFTFFHLPTGRCRFATLIIIAITPLVMSFFAALLRIDAFTPRFVYA